MLAMQSRPLPLQGGDLRHSNAFAYPGGPTRRVRRVPVSSCDQCRVKKMRCDAKERPHGETCANCERYGRRCTFRDKESDMASKGHEKPQRSRPNRASSSTSLSQKQVAKKKKPEARPEWGLLSMASSHSSSSTTIPCTQPALLFWPHTPNDSLDQGRHPFWLRASKGRSLSLPRPQHAYDEDSGGYFAVPSSITSAATGIAQQLAAENVIEMVLARFYDSAPTVANLIAPPRTDMLQRYRVKHPSAMPLYLVHVLVACSAATQYHPEGEIRTWAPVAWRGAVEAVQERLSAPCAPDLDLIRALLLLTITSAGSPASPERATSFETALALAQSLKLNSRQAAEHCSTQERSVRLQLFWILYVVDKLLAVARETQPLLPCHDMPFLSVGDITNMGLPGREAHVLQGLALATIHLTQILESVQIDLYGSSSTIFTQIESVQSIVQPLEQRLEEWCKSSRQILFQGQSPLGRCVASSVISLLHLVQLQLYSFSLRLEASLPSSTLPITFKNANFKAMIGSVESSLHLIRRGNFRADGRAAVKEVVGRCNPTTKPMNFDVYLIDRGSAFLRFLSAAWAGWAHGDGVFKLLRSSAPAEQLSSGSETPGDAAIDTATDETMNLASSLQKAELPPTESFTGRRSSTTTVLAHRPKKSAPAPLPLATCLQKSGKMDAFPRLDVTTMAALDIPMTPAHQLFEALTTVQHGGTDSNPDSDDPAAALFDCSLMDSPNIANEFAPAPKNEITGTGLSEVQSGESLTRNDEFSALLGFDLQVPLFSPSVPPYLNKIKANKNNATSSNPLGSTGLTPFLSVSGYNLAAPPSSCALWPSTPTPAPAPSTPASDSTTTQHAALLGGGLFDIDDSRRMSD